MPHTGTITIDGNQGPFRVHINIPGSVFCPECHFARQPQTHFAQQTMAVPLQPLPNPLTSESNFSLSTSLLVMSGNSSSPLYVLNIAASFDDVSPCSHHTVTKGKVQSRITNSSSPCTTWRVRLPFYKKRMRGTPTPVRIRRSLATKHD